MRLPRMIGTFGFASVLAVAAGMTATAHDTDPHGPWANPHMFDCPYADTGYHMMGDRMGPGMMGYGMPHGMRGYGMPHGMMGQGRMGPGMMGQGRMGPGMMMDPDNMGPGSMGPGMMGHGMGRGTMQALPRDLTPEQVRHMFEHHVEMGGNPNLKVGDVAESGEDSITAEIVTQDGSLVRRFEVNRHTGAMRPVQ